MKKNNIKYVVVLLLGMLCTKSIAQQDPSFTMYQFNMNVINPAYAGSSETTEVTAMIRSQWTGVKDSPSTQTLSFSSPTILGNNMGVGLSIVNDKFNVEKETDVFVDFSYKLPIAEDLDLFLGLKGGGTFLFVDLVSLGITNDDLLSKNPSLFNPNFGTGAYLKGENYYASLSAPSLLKSKRDKTHIYLSGGYTIDFAGDYKTKLTPSVMVRHVSGVSPSIDVTMLANMLDNYELGLSHRMKESFSVFGLFKFLEHYKVGYAFEYATTDISTYTNGSHEFIFKYNF